MQNANREYQQPWWKSQRQPDFSLRADALEIDLQIKSFSQAIFDLNDDHKLTDVPPLRVALYGHDIDFTDFTSDDPTETVYDTRNTKNPINAKWAANRLRANWSDCNALGYLVAWDDRFNPKTGRTVRRGLKSVVGFRLDFDASAGFGTMEECRDYVASFGLTVSKVIQTGVGRFHVLVKIDRYPYRDLEPINLIRNAIPKADHRAGVSMIRLPGSINKGRFRCVSDDHPVGLAMPFQAILDGFYQRGLVSLESIRSAGATVLLDRDSDWRECWSPSLPEENNRPELDSKVSQTHISFESLENEPSEQAPAGAKGKRPTATFVAKFKPQILNALQSLKPSQFRYQVRWDAQASYLANCLGFLNGGQHGIAIAKLATAFKIDPKTAARLRGEWIRVGLIVKTRNTRTIKKAGRIVRASDEFCSGPILQSLASPGIRSVEGAITYLNDKYPLCDGYTYDNAVHWVNRLRDQGLSEERVVEIMYEHDTSGTRKWSREVRRMWDGYQPMPWSGKNPEMTGAAAKGQQPIKPRDPFWPVASTFRKKSQPQRAAEQPSPQEWRSYCPFSRADVSRIILGLVKKVAGLESLDLYEQLDGYGIRVRGNPSDSWDRAKNFTVKMGITERGNEVLVSLWASDERRRDIIEALVPFVVRGLSGAIATSTELRIDADAIEVTVRLNRAVS